MSFEIVHFRDADKILTNKKMLKDVTTTMQYVDDVLFGAHFKRELLRHAMDEMGWISENGNMKILDGRQYRYKGFKRGIGIDGSFGAYEYILEGLLRLQLGFDQGKIEVGVLMLNARRSEKTPYGSTQDLVRTEIELLYPTISLPVSVCLFDLGNPRIPEETNTEEACTTPDD